MSENGISHLNRQLLASLHRKLASPFTVNDASPVVALDLRKTRRFLAYLADRGWLARVRQGLYVTVPLEATSPAHWHEDSWISAAKIFEPCYIGGWSACEHWGLTEQIFREVVVITGKRVRNRREEIQGTPFRIKVLPSAKLFGTETVWRRQVRVQVSDPSRTIVDILDAPELGGGVRHVSEVVAAYFESERRDDKLLVEYAERLGNRSVFKRLGSILETLKIAAPELIETCLLKKSAGVTLLDPTAPAKGPITRRWNLRLNVQLGSKP